jgi:enoyl-CoA hydratase/carnithine racemase
MTAPKTIRIDHSGNTTKITLDRPEVMNCISMDMHHELQDAFDAFAADPAQRVCVVTGAGEKAFCAGSDLKGGGGKSYPKNGYAGLVERFDLNKPIIAAVNGVALGGGFEIVLACDIVIAAEAASFGLPEPRVGAVAVAGGLHRLARQIGLRQAMGVVLSSRRFSATEGLRMGFVNEVAASGELSAAVSRWCADIVKGAPLAISASKETMLRGLDEPTLADALRNQSTYPAFAAHASSEDLREGVRAFAEKRPPAWAGR